MTTAFKPGLALAEAFYTDVVAPLIDVSHTACLLGEGSDILGYDSTRSTDHEWGPRVQLFVGADQVDRVRSAVARDLPTEYDGLPTAWFSLATNTVTHPIEVTTFDAWIVAQIGFDPQQDMDAAAWLGLPQQRLLHVTRGNRLAADSNQVVRAGSRTPSSLSGPGQPVRFCWDQPSTWASATADADTVYLVRPDLPDAPERITAFSPTRRAPTSCCCPSRAQTGCRRAPGSVG